MKVCKKITVFIVVLTIVASAFPVFSSAVPAGALLEVSNIMVTPGGNASQLNFTWFAQVSDSRKAYEAKVQIALKSDMSGSTFPEANAETFTGTITTVTSSLDSFKVTSENLVPGTDYVYRVGYGDKNEVFWSEVYNFSTIEYLDGDGKDNFSFIFIGDPGVGSGWYEPEYEYDDDGMPIYEEPDEDAEWGDIDYSDLEADTKAWQDTLNAALNQVKNPAFILSAGDQVADAESKEQLDALLSPSQFTSVPFAPTINSGEASKLWHSYFNLPNYAENNSNYYFRYGSALFIVLNSNVSSHSLFIKNTIESNKEAQWRVIVMNHSLYSAGTISAADANYNSLKNSLIKVFSTNQIDVVFSGRDLVYSRTNFLDSGEVKNPLTRLPVGLPDPPPSGDFKPDGAMFVTAGSSTGLSSSSLATTIPKYIDNALEPDYPTFSQVNITEISFEIVTYNAKTLDIVDRYKFLKPYVDRSIEEEKSGNEIIVPTDPPPVIEKVDMPLSPEAKTAIIIGSIAAVVVAVCIGGYIFFTKR